MEKIYSFEFTQKDLDNLHIMVKACLQIGNSKIDFEDGRPSIMLAEPAVDIKRAIESQLTKKVITKKK